MSCCILAARFLGVYYLGRHWHLSHEAAGLAGVSYIYGGHVLFQACNISYLVGACWLPWGLLWWDRWLHERRTPQFDGDRLMHGAPLPWRRSPDGLSLGPGGRRRSVARRRSFPYRIKRSVCGYVGLPALRGVATGVTVALLCAAIQCVPAVEWGLHTDRHQPSASGHDHHAVETRGNIDETGVGLDRRYAF